MWHKDVKIFVLSQKFLGLDSWQHRKAKVPVAFRPGFQQVLCGANGPGVTTLYDSEGYMCWQWKPSSVSF